MGKVKPYVEVGLIGLAGGLVAGAALIGASYAMRRNGRAMPHYRPGVGMLPEIADAANHAEDHRARITAGEGMDGNLLGLDYELPSIDLEQTDRRVDGFPIAMSQASAGDGRREQINL
jgi:hypothetical protein